MNLTYFRPKIKRECGKQKHQPSQYPDLSSKHQTSEIYLGT